MYLGKVLRALVNRWYVGYSRYHREYHPHTQSEISCFLFAYSFEISLLVVRTEYLRRSKLKLAPIGKSVNTVLPIIRLTDGPTSR